MNQLNFRHSLISGSLPLIWTAEGVKDRVFPQLLINRPYIDCLGWLKSFKADLQQQSQVKISHMCIYYKNKAKLNA